MCDEFFGTAEDVGKRLDVTLHLEDVQQPGFCIYGSDAPDDAVVLQVSDTKPEQAALLSKSGVYYTSVSMMVGGELTSVDAERRDDVVEWLHDRASAVEDDRDAWVADLPAVSPGYTATEGYSLDEDDSASTGIWSSPTGDSETESVLLTPYGQVAVSPLDALDVVWIDGEETRAADGERFVAARVTVAASDARTVEDFTLHVDGEDASAQARDALDELVAGKAMQLLVSVPADAAQVQIGVGRDGIDTELQLISLIDGEIDDDGKSERLAAAVDGTASADETAPIVYDEDGAESWRSVPTTYAPYSIAWAVTPWTATDGWSPDDQEILVVALEPYYPERAQPLTVADATAVVDGMEVAPMSYDPTTYSYSFGIVPGADRAEVQVRISADAPEPGYTLSGPVLHDIPIDLNSGSSTHG